MSKEIELLRRCADQLNSTLNGTTSMRLAEEIEELLAQPEPEPVAWMYDWNIIEEEEYGETRYDCLTRADSITKSRAITNVRPLYKLPPKRKPIDLDQVDNHLKICDLSEDYRNGYSDGIVFAEIEHGIGE